MKMSQVSKCQNVKASNGHGQKRTIFAKQENQKIQLSSCTILVFSFKTIWQAPKQECKALFYPIAAFLALLIFIDKVSNRIFGKESH